MTPFQINIVIFIWYFMYGCIKMFYFAICVLIFIIQPVKPMEMMKSTDKYGAFILKSMEVERCHGPKLMDLAEVNCKIKKIADDNLIGTFDISVLDAVKLDELKIMVYSLKDGKKKNMWNYKLSEPCKHFAVGSILTQYLKAEKCVVKPGQYNFELNISEIVHKFFGGAFFYGNYMIKVIGLAKKGNVACLLFNEVFVKKEGS